MSSITKAPPQLGWIQGNFASGRVDLQFDRRQHTVGGQVENDRVSLTTHHNDGLVKGQARGAEVQLAQNWTPRRVILDGWANKSRYRMDIDYDRKQANGSSGASAIQLQFDLQQGFLRGRVGQDAVDLSLNHQGRLQGNWGQHRVSAEMINLDLGHLMSHLYLVTP